jgi:hypothetical protein
MADAHAHVGREKHSSSKSVGMYVLYVLYPPHFRTRHCGAFTYQRPTCAVHISRPAAGRLLYTIYSILQVMIEIMYGTVVLGFAALHYVNHGRHVLHRTCDPGKDCCGTAPLSRTLRSPSVHREHVNNNSEYLIAVKPEIFVQRSDGSRAQGSWALSSRVRGNMSNGV